MGQIPETTSEHPARPAVRGPRYTTRTILTAVALGAAVGVTLIPINFAQAAVTAAAPMVGVMSWDLGDGGADSARAAAPWRYRHRR